MPKPIRRVVRTRAYEYVHWGLGAPKQGCKSIRINTGPLFTDLPLPVHYQLTVGCQLVSSGTQIAHQYSPAVYMALAEFPKLQPGRPWERVGPCLTSEMTMYPNNCTLMDLTELRKKCSGSVTSSKDVTRCATAQSNPVSVLDPARCCPRLDG